MTEGRHDGEAAPVDAANPRGWKPARAHVSGRRVFYAPSPTPGRWWRMTARTPEEAEHSARFGRPHAMTWAYLQSIIRPETDAEAREP